MLIFIGIGIFSTTFWTSYARAEKNAIELEVKMLKDILNEQRKCCEFYEENFTPVNLDQLVVISDGVLEGGKPVEGVRYNSPVHMSGWWLTTDDFDGDTNTLKNLHFSHIIHKRPDLALYMALPYGYRFLLGSEIEQVWSDEQVRDE